MNIYDPYPDRVTVDGKEYILDLAYDNVLKAIDVHEMYELTRGDRSEVMCALLLAYPDRDTPDTENARTRLLNAIFELFPKGEDTQERTIDFHQDAAMIRSAFFRIGIDLLKDRIHFCRFIELLGDLPRDTALMRTVEIRIKPLPKPTKDNMEQIAELQKLKAKVAIRYTDEEQKKRFADSLKNSSVLRG